jgi:putative endonuclease
MHTKIYYVYILASLSHSLYVGITSDLKYRVWEHKEGIFAGHTSKYKINRLVYYEQYEDVWNAIEREKRIKGWLRKRKLELIEEHNPQWLDLAADWE